MQMTKLLYAKPEPHKSEIKQLYLIPNLEPDPHESEIKQNGRSIVLLVSLDALTYQFVLHVF